MNKTDKVLLAILSIWTFINCFLMIQAINYPKEISFLAATTEEIPRGNEDGWVRYVLNKSDKFYPFTDFSTYKGTYSEYFNVIFYDYSEFFVYVAGAWLLFLLYKLLSPKK